jgi:hypothetical protein
VDPADNSTPPQGMVRGDDDPQESPARRSEDDPLPEGWNHMVEALVCKNRLMHPGERRIRAVHKHPAVLAWNVILTVAVAAALGWVSTYIGDKAGKNGNVTFSITLFHHIERVVENRNNALIDISLVHGLTLFYLMYRIAAWQTSYLAITDRQILLIAGQPILRFRFASVRINQVTSWYLRESFGGNWLGYKSLVVKVGDHDGVARTIGHVPGIVVESIEEALPSDARYAGDEEAFNLWNAGGLRRRVRLVIAVLLTCLLVVLAVAAAINSRIRTELSNQTEIIALLPILITLITPKS